MDLKVIEWEDIFKIYVVQGKEEWGLCGNTVMNSFAVKYGEFLEKLKHVVCFSSG